MLTTPRSAQDYFSPWSRRFRMVMKLVILIVVVALLGGVVWLAARTLPTTTIPGITARSRGPELPPLSTIGSTNPADPMSEQRARVSFADLTNNMPREAVIAAINERLGLASADADNDGLSNAAEVLIYGTNPRYHDSDVDGANDGQEIAAATNPLSAANSSTDEERAAVTRRTAYWQTDFQLTVVEQAKSQRDMVRLAHAGQIRVLLHLYYEDNNRYPNVSSWDAAWAELKSKDAGQMFSHTSAASTWVQGMNDPLSQEPFVYSYATADQGKSFTFTYAVEGEGVRYTFTDTQGEPGTTEKASLSVASPAAVSLLPNPRALVAKAASFIPVALANHVPLTAYFIDSVNTSDGQRVEVYGNSDLSSFWRDEIPLRTLAEVRHNFSLAAAAYTPPGYCTAQICYCINGATLVFTNNDAQCDGGVLTPTGNTVLADQPFEAVVRLRNTGTSIWRTDATTPHQLAAAASQDPSTPLPLLWGAGRVGLETQTVHPGDSHDFAFTAVAPPQPGTYDFDFRMVEEFYEFFGATCRKSLTVVAAQCSDGRDNDADGRIDYPSDPGCSSPSDDDEQDPPLINNAACVGINVSAGLNTGQPFTATVTMQNTGTRPWITDATPHRLGSRNPQDNYNWGFHRVSLPVSPINPGSTAIFQLSGTAPATAGTYDFAWEMVEDGVEWFGPICQRQITVQPAPSLPPSPVPAPIVDLQVNGQNGPLTVPAGTSVTLSWSGAHAASCNASGAWTGTKPASGVEQTNALTASVIFGVTCTGPGGSATDSVTVNIAPANLTPVVDLRVNGQDGPLTVQAGTTVTLTWDGANVTSCNASGAWTGTRPTTGTEQTSPLTGNVTFTVTCAGQGSSVIDSVRIRVTPATNTTQCADGVDNEQPVPDGKIDCDDPGCRTIPTNPATCNPADNSEVDPSLLPGDIREDE